MPPDTYPSPDRTQIGAGPFFTQNGGEQPHIPNDLQQLQVADIPRAIMGGMSNGGHDYGPESHAGHDASHLPTSPQRLAQGVLHISGPQPGLGSADGPRKRSKVSRACDECRRKKIRCDASTETEDGPCANCKRTGAHCQFSRQPMKRGPSKGYIKELADRLNNLETQLGPQGQQLHHADLAYMRSLADEGMAQHMAESQDYSPPPTAQMSRKRKYSLSEGIFARDQHPYAPARSAASGPWSTDSPRYLPAPSSVSQYPQTPHTTTSEVDRLPIQTSPNSGSIYRQAALDDRRNSASMSYNSETREDDPSALQSWDESVVDEYYRIIHQTFPLLPHSKVRLRSHLSHCPATLREAFFTALDCATRSSTSSHLQYDINSPNSTKKAAELISASQYEGAATRSVVANIIYLQTLVLMAIESDNHGPTATHGQVGLSGAEWLGRAIGVANYLKLNTPRSGDRYDEVDPDTDDKLGRRAWWILFMLDRWRAASNSSNVHLPDNGSCLLNDDEALLGELSYQLARLTHILGHLTMVLQQPPALMSSTSAAAPIISTAILGEMDRFRESAEDLLLGAPNPVQLAYWHVRLLVLRLTPSTGPHELLGAAMRIVSILNNVYAMTTPLNHHFTALAALTLVELSAFDETRYTAEKGIDDIVQALNAKRTAVSRERSFGWDSAVRELITRKKTEFATLGEKGVGGAAVGLQHLADAAIGDDRRPETPTSAGAASTTQGPASASAANAKTEAHPGPDFDPALLTRYGYLAALHDPSTR